MNRALRCALIGLLAFPLVAKQAQQPTSKPAQQRPPEQAPAGFLIAGRVVDKLSGAPLPGTRVSLALATGRSQPATVTADDDGRFEFTNLERGKYQLTAVRRGYPQQSFDSHEQFATAIVTGPAQENGNLLFKLAAESIITGRVTDEMNETVRNATVLLIHDGLVSGAETTLVERQAQTDDQGAYRFSRVRSGKHYIAVAAQPWYAQHPTRSRPEITNEAGTFRFSSPPPPPPDPALDVAYPLTYYPEAIEMGGATPIVLQPGSRFTADVTLHPVRALRLLVRAEASPGRVLNANLTERALEGYQVPAHSVGGGQQGPGLVEINGIAPGHYLLSVRSFDQQRGTGGQNAWEREVDIENDMEIDAGEPPGSVPVSGILKFDDGSDRGVTAGISLRKVSPERGAQFSFMAQMQPSGEFTFAPGLPPGGYDIQIQRPDVYVKGIAASGAKVVGKRVEITGNEPVQLTITASQGVGRVDGIALRDDKRVAGAMVVLVPLNKSRADSTELFRRDQSDSDGTFTLPNILPGKYAVIAIANGWELEWANPAVLKPYLESATAVEVAAKGKYTVKVTVQP